MRFNLISNLANGVGLERDYQLLKAELESLGHKVTGIQFNHDKTAPAAEVNIFLEVVDPKFFILAAKQWAIPNPEWWFTGWDEFLPRFDKVLAKTQHCFQLFRDKNARCDYLGWMSRDLLDASVPRQRKFLHVAGKSQTKNTDAVVGAWQRFKPEAELTVVSEQALRQSVQRVTWIRRVPEEDLPRLMNEHLFHLMPSAYEGWGHALHEALGVGAVVITTDAPPMNENGAAFLVKSESTKPFNSVPIHKVSARGVAEVVNSALAADEMTLSSVRASARERFELERYEWKQRIADLAGRA